MTALASLKRKPCSQSLNLSTLTRKALQADLRQRITDEHSDIARQADGVGVARRRKRRCGALRSGWRGRCGATRRGCAESTAGLLNGRTLPTALPAGPKAFRSSGNPPFIRRNLLLRTQFPHVLRCGKTASASMTAWCSRWRFHLSESELRDFYADIMDDHFDDPGRNSSPGY